MTFRSKQLEQIDERVAAPSGANVAHSGDMGFGHKVKRLAFVVTPHGHQPAKLDLKFNHVNRLH